MLGGLFFLLGLMSGSFLNVVIYRLIKRDSLLFPGSHCMYCQSKLRFFEIIPVLSYVFLKGQCRYCGHKLPLVYPIVELMSGIAFWLLYMQRGMTWDLLPGYIFTAFLITVAFMDGLWGIIPDRLNYPTLVIGLLLSLWMHNIFSALIGMIALGGLFLLIFIFSQGGLGGGDVKLALVIGVFCGWPGALGAFFIASVLAAVYAVVLLVSKKAGLKSAIKFGPFLALGSWAAWVYADIISLGFII
ncbi:MAG: prepilin peptidase [Syntrophomonadaceae bacterium]|nr:prepilin peptidase [Syntrophomonadaceae bacterium]